MAEYGVARCGPERFGIVRSGMAGFGMEQNKEITVMDTAIAEVNSVAKYPLDFDNIQKGDVISREAMEQIFGFTEKDDTTKWAFEVMKLRARIMEECADRGNPVTVKGESGSLRVLLDSEASDYNARGFNLCQHKMVGFHGRMLDVDCSRFTEEMKTKHDRRVCNQGKILLSMHEHGGSRLIPAQYRRSTPTMITDSSQS